MKLIKITKISLMCLLLSFLQTSNAQEKIVENGWTNESYKQFVNSCVASAVNNNMKHLIDKEKLTVDSEKYISTLKKVNQHQTAVCECTQIKIMKDYRFNEIDKMMNNKSYIIDTAKNCSEKVLGSAKK